LAYGRAYIRVADEDKVMTSSELEIFYLKKNAGRDIWDSDLSCKTIDDIDETVLRDYIDRANRAGRIGFSYTTKSDVLNKLEMVEDGKLKNAAYALFVDSNMIEVQMAIFAGAERLTFNDIRREHGSVTDLIRIAERYVKSNIRWRVAFEGSIERKEIPEIPVDAVREAMINSYCHRDYKSSQNNEVLIYKNRVKIYNPATFSEGLKPEDFIDGDEPSVKRNPQLAQLMCYSKDIESFGTGLKRISVACKESGVKLEFRLMKWGFGVVFYRPDEDFNLTEKASDVVLNKAEKNVLSCIIENRTVTAEQIAIRLSKSERTIQRYLNRLQKKNVIRRVGSRKDGYWEVIGRQ
jgi:ATP-dependent DNA helicase RecG